MKTRFMKEISWCLVVAFFSLVIAPKTDAALAPSAPLGVSGYEKTADMMEIQTFLEKKEVSSRLEELGYTKEEIESRLSKLDAREIHDLALNVDNLKTGGGAYLFVGVIFVASIIVIVLYKLFFAKKVAART